MTELPVLLDAETVARLTGLNVEWIWSRRYLLPCDPGPAPFDVKIHRGAGC